MLNQEREEHQRRSPECAFFTLSQSMTMKPTRAKQGRPSKASQISTQSNTTAAIEDLSILGGVAEEGNSIATIATNMTTASTKSKVGRLGGTAKLGKGKARSKAVKYAMAEEVAQDNTFVEPEDDDFEVKVHTDSPEVFRGKKRPSSEMEANDPPLEDSAGTAKRRATRTKSSMNKPQIEPDHAESFKTVNDTHMTNTKDIPPPTLPFTKKGGRPGRKRGSSTARKASSISTASTASLRGVPTDTEIDAALEADLYRPLTDDDAEEEACRGPKSRRLTRTRPQSKQVSASTVPTRETAQPSTSSVEDHQVEVRVEILKLAELDAALSTTADGNPNSTPTSLQMEHSTNVKTKPKKMKGQAKVSITAKVSKKQEILSMEKEHSTISQPTDNEILVVAPISDQIDKADWGTGDKTQQFSTKNRSAASPKLKQSKSRQPSRQIAGRGGAESIVSAADPPCESQLDMRNPVLTTNLITDELLYVSDTNTMTVTPLRPGKKIGSASKKGETSKKVDPPQQIENIVPTLMKEAEDCHFLSSSQNIDSEKREASVGSSVPLAFNADFEERNRARESSTKEPNIAQEAERVSKPKPDKGPQKAKASLSSSLLMQKQDERSLESQTLLSLGLSTTAVSAVESFGSSFSPAFQPPTSIPIVPSPTPSPQFSDAENQPPSSRPSQQRPPLFEISPSRPQATRIHLAVSTPNTSPSQRNIASMVHTTFPWTIVDVENILFGSSKAVRPLSHVPRNRLKDCLSSPEKKMTVEDWIQFNAEKSEQDLRNECERLVGRFEGEGNQALRALEGVICKDS